MTLKQLEQYFTAEISTLYPQEESKQMFVVTAEHFSGLTRSQLILKGEYILSNEEELRYKAVAGALKNGEPLQHILGEAWFYGLKFRVNGSVLIPRPETEELVQWVIDTVQSDGTTAKSILDIGTGSGCIAVSIKKNLEGAAVSALDISAGALEIARENALTNGASINFLQADIVTYDSPSTYDIIVSNPPYITPEEQAGMAENVLFHEPHLALFVTSENPLVFYIAIANFALDRLNSGGMLFFEINEYFGKEMIEMLTRKGFRNIELRKDLQGKERMIRCFGPDKDATSADETR